MNIFEQISQKILYIFNKKSLKKDLNKLYYKNSTSTQTMNSCCTLKFSAGTEAQNKEINEKLKKLLKKYINNPEKLIQYIKLKGINFIQIKNAGKLLSKIGEEPGFIIPLKGKKAFFINFLIGLVVEKKLKFDFSTKEMFIFDNGNIEIYALARALYKYYSYKKGLPGYDYEAQELYKKVYGNLNVRISSFALNLNQMYACKEALARNLEAINFTLELSLENERSKLALNKMLVEKGTHV